MRRFLQLIVAAVILCSNARDARGGLDLDAPLPLSSRVMIDTLPNGFTYYIRRNTEPKNRIEIRLVVNAGALQEDDDQHGAAHLVEHMAFNGTEHFDAQEIVRYLESIGMRSGGDVNASTSFDATIYQLRVPADSAQYLDRALLIVRDWACGQTFPREEFEKERKVVIEEWRLGRGASQRLWKRHQKVLFAGSPYADRLPIGTRESLESMTREAVVRFYHDWYRPDLMAIVVVGDVDPERMRTRIVDTFQDIPPAPAPRVRKTYVIPIAGDTSYSIASDPEADVSVMRIVTRLPFDTTRTVGDLRRALVRSLVMAMLNERYSDLEHSPDPPFVSAGISSMRPVRGLNGLSLQVVLKGDDMLGGIRALLVEAERARRSGFLQTELDRARARMMSGLEHSYAERDRITSSEFADECAAWYLSPSRTPDIETLLELAKQLAPTIDLEQVNALARGLLGASDRVVMLDTAKKTDAPAPTEEGLRALFHEIAKMELSPYVDSVPDSDTKGLMPVMPEPGDIVSEKHDDEFDITEWRLSNGIRVFVKKTDFKNDEVLFRAWSPGGTSLAPDSILASAASAFLIHMCGVADFDQRELDKRLAGKQVSLSPTFEGLYEGFKGGAAPGDLETMFQLLYLYITAPRRDRDAFEALLSRMRWFIEQRKNNPHAVFEDSLTAIMLNHHPRALPISPGTLDSIDFETAFRFYVDRFSDVGDFTMAFVGAIDEDLLRRYVRTYVASLPTRGREESWKDRGGRRPEGVVVRTFRKGMEDKARTAIVFSGPCDASVDHVFDLETLAQALSIRLREEIRESEGEAYGFNVQWDMSPYPREEFALLVSFQAAPQKIDDVVDHVFGVIRDLQEHGATDDVVTRLVSEKRRALEEARRTNTFWLRSLVDADRLGVPLDDLVVRERLLKRCSSERIRDAARKYCNWHRYVRLTMLPEKTESAN